MYTVKNENADLAESFQNMSHPSLNILTLSKGLQNLLE